MRKRKSQKKGVAMVLALITVFLIMVMATSYLGITVTGNKAAKNYKTEAMALSFAQAGIDAVLNAMGEPANWVVEKTTGLNTLSPDGKAVGLRIKISVDQLNPSQNKMFDNLLNSDLANGVQLTPDPNARVWFGEFMPVTNISGAQNGETLPSPTFVTAAPIPLPQQKFGILIIAINPENANGGDVTVRPVSGVPMIQDNISYRVGVASFVYESLDAAENARDHITDSSIVMGPTLVASRAISVRTSYAFPGSIYQNTRAFDNPSDPRASIFGSFAYPNAQELTADAAFLDENANWDGGIRADGHLSGKDSHGNKLPEWGAPQLTRNFNLNSFATAKEGGGESPVQQAYDSSGSIKISFLNKDLEDKALNPSNNLANESKITKFKSILSTQKGAEAPGIVFQKISGSGEKYSEFNNEAAVKNNVVKGITNPSVPVDEGVIKTSNSTESIWNQADESGNVKSKLSSLDEAGNPVPGLYDQLASNGQPESKWYKTYGNTDQQYTADKLYANEKMEVPTVRITIGNEPTQTGEKVNRYTIEQIEYYNDNGTIRERTVSGTRDSFTDKEDGFNNMIYIKGANVQVQGATGLQYENGQVVNPVTIVSDTNENVDAQSYSAAGGDGNGARKVGKFDGRLVAPNLVNAEGQYAFLDMTYNSNTGMYEENTTIGATRFGVPMSAVSQTRIDALRRQGFTDVFPPISEYTEQPVGNISVIGDLAYQKGTQASLALVAKNRVYLNDFTHQQVPSGDVNPAAIPEKTNQTKTGDGVLKLDAVVASERHNMTMDFYNASKNLNYDTSGNVGVKDMSNATRRPPGYQNNDTNNPYNVLLNKALYDKMTSPENAQLLAENAQGCTNLSATTTTPVSASGQIYRFNKFVAMNRESKTMLWKDYYFGAVRTSNSTIANDGNPDIYSQGLFNFTGAVISRFADIEADAGVRGADGKKRIHQMGYPGQIMSFDANLLDRSAPYFSTTNGRLSDFANGAVIRWTILSYIDRGAISQQQKRI